MAVYDSAKTRRAAGLIGWLAESVNSGVSPALRRSTEEADAMQGKTAEALEERLLLLTKKYSGMVNELEELSRLLNSCADVMEETDEQLAGKL